MNIRVPIEVDVTQVNKTWFSAKNMNPAKHYVVGMFQRKGNIIIRAIPDNNPETVAGVISTFVAAGCLVYSEIGVIPDSIKGNYEVHEIPAGKHAQGDIHVNNVKSAWRDLKRVIKTTHISVSQKHMQLYCGEVAWKINNAHLSPTEKFNLLLSQCLLVKPPKKSESKNFIK